MVMKPDVVDAALAAARRPGSRTIYLSPRGRTLDQALVRELATEAEVVFLCGRYEGVDQRGLVSHAVEEVSLGDLVRSGGEPAALRFDDAGVRVRAGGVGQENQP